MNDTDMPELVSLLAQLQLEHLRAVKEDRAAETLFLVARIVELVGSARDAIDVVASVDARALHDLLAGAGLDAEDGLQGLAIGFGDLPEG